MSFLRFFYVFLGMAVVIVEFGLSQARADAAPECAPSGKETQAVKVDGVVLGIAEELSIVGKTVTLKRGIFPLGALLQDWNASSTKNGPDSETHRLTFIELTPELDLTEKAVEISEASITGLLAKPAGAEGLCIYVDSATFEVLGDVKNVIKPLPPVAPPPPHP